MKKGRKQEILKILEKEIKKAQETAKKTLITAKIFTRASRSQQGDRLYFQNTARLAEDRLIELLNLKKEITNVPDESLKIAEPISFVTLIYQNGEKQSFYLVNKSPKLTGLQLITPQSPLGKSIAGKKQGENFSYQAGENDETTTYSGKIEKIE